MQCYCEQEFRAPLEIRAPPGASAATDDKARPAALELPVTRASLEALAELDLADHKVDARWLYFLSAVLVAGLSKHHFYIPISV